MARGAALVATPEFVKATEAVFRIPTFIHLLPDTQGDAARDNRCFLGVIVIGIRIRTRVAIGSHQQDCEGLLAADFSWDKTALLGRYVRDGREPLGWVAVEAVQAAVRLVA